MKAKKSQSAYLENKRISIFMVGLMFVGSLILSAFTYTTPYAKYHSNAKTFKSTTINYLEETKKESPPKIIEPLTKYTPPVDEKIKEKSNENKIITPTIIVIPPDIKSDTTEIVIIDEEIIEFPDIEASFPGGTTQMIKWIGLNVKYPDISVQLNEQGRIYVSFVVEKDGTITNIQIERGISDDLNREAKRLIREMPAWSPAETKGKKVRTKCSLPIVFKLEL